MLLLIAGLPCNLLSQEPPSVSPLPCYFQERYIPGGVHELNDPGFTDNSEELLRMVATLPPEGGYNRMLMTDCNHNGLKEFIYRGEGPKLYFVENQGDAFSTIDSITGFFYIPLAAGDLDGDNLADLVVQEGNFVRVLESASSSAFPKTIVWSHALDGQHGEGRFEQYAQITDLDFDGANEILMTANTFPLLSGYGYVSIFEKISNNNYSRKFYYGFNYQNSILGYIAVDDFDNDSKMEFACAAGLRDTLYIFENLTNDTYALKFKAFTGLRNQYPVIAGNDLDNDGKVEIFVSGDNFSQEGYRNIQMYEAAQNDVFLLSSTIVQYTGLVGFQPISTGNLFQGGNDELVLEAHRIFIYNSSGNNEFDIRDSSLFYYNATNALCYDITPGGLNEVQIIRSGSDIIVFDNPTFTGITGNNHSPQSFALYQNYPNPFNASSKIRFQVSKPGNIKINVYDILGRELTVLLDEAMKPGTYEITVDGSNLPSGVYFYRLTAGQFNDVKKMVLTR